MAANTPRSAFSGVPTPIRAITTPLRSTVAPPIPPASELYEPLAKAVLRRRLTNRIFLYTSLISTVGTSVWLFWTGRLTLTRLFIASLTLWAGGILPVILLRKSYLTVTHTTAPSPLLLVQKSLAPPLSSRTMHALQTHLFSALCILAIHASIDNTLPVFIKSRKHPYTPHPVFVLLALSQSILAVLYVLRSVLRDVWVFPFRRPSLTPSVAAVLGPVLLPVLALPVALIALFVVIPILRRLPVLSLLLRAILYPHASVLRSLGRAWTLGVQTMGAWEVAAAIWGWSIGEPLRTTPAVRALVSGISVAATPAPTPSASSSVLSTPSSLSRSSFLAPPPPPFPDTPAPAPISIYTHLAYAELLALASSSDSGALKVRSEAFDVEGAVWSRLARETLILIGREYRVLLGRGTPPAPAAPPSKPAQATPSVPATPSPFKPSLLIKENIFAKKTPSSPASRLADALASGGPVEEIVAPAMESLAKAPIPVPELQLQKYVPDWRSYIPAPRLPVWATAHLNAVLAVSLPRAWTQPRKGREVAGWVPRRELCIEAIGVLSHLTCASLAEDRFGVVQRDIPRVIEALLEFLGAVEEAQEGLRPKGTDSGSKEGELLTPEQAQKEAAEAADLIEARAVLGDVADALKEGVARIVRTFGDKLRAFRFPPRTAARLQGFVDYCA
ncbi:nucleoporin protein Ndc1-Nup-domain-containing protein [Roridomyces roridus]|uniref:Nucleoporin protein Ndc1-Nup-domain-containing protein n=1 Tax=Roridomyces roridus TaxID=1738132 RepID=A0AAD7CEL3_9AGAR|nr:nucleoporin protein Ndc1-Nup-domain-containing protein [Roridomyces roridus]